MTPGLAMLILAPIVYLFGWRLGRMRWRGMENDALLCRAAVDSSIDTAIMVHDLADRARVVYANPAACRYLGVDLATLVTWTPEQWDPHHLADTMALPDGRPRCYETEHLTASGERVPVEVTLSRLDLAGRDYLLSHARDLRPQRDMEARALRLEKRALELRLERGYKEIYDNLLDAILLLDVASDGRVVVAGCNRSAEALLGIAMADALGKPGKEAFPGGLADRLAALDAICLSSGTPVHYHDVVALPGGARHVEIALIPLSGAAGGIHRIIVILRDVTERERAAMARHERAEEYRLLVEQSPDIIARYDRDCRRRYANPTLAEMAGPDAPLIGTRPSEFPGGESALHYERRICSVLERGEDAEFELAWAPRGEEARHTLVSLSAERDPAGAVVGVLAIGRDITERKRQESREMARGEVFNLLSAGAELREVLAKVVAFAELSRPGLFGAILLPDPAGATLGHGIAPSLPEAFLHAIEQVPIAGAGCACCAAAFRKEPVMVEDLGARGCASTCQAMTASSGLAACWAVPIVDSDGELLGTFAFFRDRPGLPDDRDQAMMEQASQMARLVIERRRTEARIRHQADYDMLTGLPNRTLLRERLAGMMNRADRLALLYIDIDNFKEINDTLGHHLGDQMLEEAARRLRAAVPHGDLVARMSGDEFVVVLSDADQAERIAEGMRKDLSGDYTLGHGKVWGSVSIGIALYPEHTRALDELLSHADQALFAAKAAGRNCLRVFDQAMLERTQMRVRLANDLRVALQSGQLSLHYQPIVDIADGGVVKAEALLRWAHPELGMVSPALFIPIAEETGLIHEIGDWVFREAARVAVAWNRRAWDSDGFIRRVSINRSPLQFFTGEGVRHWIAWLHQMGIPGAMLGVEITEGLLLDDRPEVTRQLAELRGEGIAISLDDFGTGYSALSYLKKFAIDYLKIDRSFVLDIVSDQRSRAIVESIIAMASSLDMRLVAEGVEEPEQAEILAAAGCRLAQGYLYARPMPEADFLAFVGTEAPARQPELEFGIGG